MSRKKSCCDGAEVENINDEASVDQKSNKNYRRLNIRWLLVLYDLCVFALVGWIFLVEYPSGTQTMSAEGIILQMLLGFACIFIARIFMNIYKQIWRYADMQAYIRLLISDVFACIAYIILERLILSEKIAFIRIVAIISINLLGCMAMRMLYYCAYQYSRRTKFGKFIRSLLRFLAGVKIKADDYTEFDEEAEATKKVKHKIKIAIVGAGRVGASLAEELFNNPRASYIPRCFIDVKKEKVGRTLYGLSVLSEAQATSEMLAELEIQEVVIALPRMDPEEKKKLYEYYKHMGCKVKIYDFPTMQSTGSKRMLREFDCEELLFRNPIEIFDEKTRAYYGGKVILITGGGGSIGSELARQIAKMNPQKLIILDVYENGAYDIQQELRIAYGRNLDVCVEIVSVCDKAGLEKVFATYRPNIVLNAAAHKHVPLMEHNCCEAVKNNVFGTLNTVELSEKYGVNRFIMVSTDKAVNPTNVMGATKRMCEMIVRSHSKSGTSTVYSATRFGNVLGSAGSVIPLFKRQIQNGGPITLTDKRIIRYFMTIPEASQLVLQSGAMAKNGELFVLDMGKPVKIIELAENMIRLSGLEPYSDIDIIEIGLRPGEKLYEELLIKSETLRKTDNDLIFIEKDDAIPLDEINRKLALLAEAVESGDDELVRTTLRKVVPTFKTPEEINCEAQNSDEMKMVSEKKPDAVCNAVG